MFDGDTDAEVLDAITAAARAESTAIAARLAAIGELDRRREIELAETIFLTTDPFDAVAAELSAALRISRGRAGTQIRHARALRDRFPQVAALLAAGHIDYRMVITLLSRTTTVDDAVCTQLDTALARHAKQWTRLSERKLIDRIDAWVARLDPHGHRVPPVIDDGRDITIEPSSAGMATIWAHTHATDAAALDQQLTALANTVCEHDPRTHAQRRADAIGPLARRQTHLDCHCGRADCPATERHTAATAAIIHILADQSTLDTTSNGPGYLPGYGILPADTVRDLTSSRAAPAAVKPVTVPGPDTTPENGYRPPAAVKEFLRWRDLTCRWPGCDAPADTCDVDHTVPYPTGPTHPSNLKNYCRAHHLVKTFATGWSDRQLPDGTIEITAPTGHTYTTTPHGADLFPSLGQSTGHLNLPKPPAPDPNRTLKAPRRRHTREHDRQHRINQERQLRAELNNDLDIEHQYQQWLTENYGPAPPF